MSDRDSKSEEALVVVKGKPSSVAARRYMRIARSSIRCGSSRVFDGDNIDGKTVALARGSSVRLEFLNRAFVDVSHALDRFGGKRMLCGTSGLQIRVCEAGRKGLEETRFGAPGGEAGDWPASQSRDFKITCWRDQ